MDDSDYSDLGVCDTIDKVIRIAGKDQFARGTRFGYSSQQRETGEQFSLGDDVIHHLLGSGWIVG